MTSVASAQGMATVTDAGPKGAALLTVLFGGEALLIQIIGIPLSLNFRFWMFMDQGANLTAQYLIGEGYRPTIDFGYHYGLLPLLVGRLLFVVAGASPTAFVVMIALCNLLIGWAFARLAQRLNLGKAGISLIAAALPFAIQASYPNFAHAVEAAMLSNAIAEQAAGRRATALALAVGACFSKPAMGYLYGALLMIFAVRDLIGQRRLKLSALYHLLACAIVTGLVLGAILGSMYGVVPLFGTLLPHAGFTAYRALDYGFFREGRTFWYFPGVRPGYFAGTVAGFWLLGTLWLLASGAAALLAIVRDATDDTSRVRNEIVLSCAAMQLAFVFLLFGNPFSWFYYSYILVMGIATTSMLGKQFRYGVWCLVLVAALGEKTFCKDSYLRWMRLQPTLETANLWASDDDRIEWEQVLARIHTDLTRGNPAVILERTGCASLLFSEFAKPVSLYLDPGMPTHEELARVAEQLSDASDVVTVRHDALAGSFVAVERALASRKLILRGKTFDVYR